jgi:hypothetical protein
MMQQRGRQRLYAALCVVCLSASAALWSVPLPAATFPNLYTATVDLDAQADDPTAAAMRAAMARVLTRVTGKRGAAMDPQLAPLIDHASDYVRSYGQPQRQKMQVGFIEGNIEKELRSLNWPVWGDERPMTLLWIAVDLGNGDRAVLPANGTSAEWSPAMSQYMQGLTDTLERIADERGLPVALPLMDLQDLNAISFPEIWGDFDAQILAASQRYRPDAVLVARLSVSQFGTRAQWTLLRNGMRQVGVGTSLDDGLNWLADRYADEFSVVGGARTERIRVQGVESLADYGRVLTYLEKLSILQSVDVDSFDGDVLNLRVTTRGDQSVLRRVLTLGAVLVPASTPAEAAGGAPAAAGQSPAVSNRLDFQLARSSG